MFLGLTHKQLQKRKGTPFGIKKCWVLNQNARDGKAGFEVFRSARSDNPRRLGLRGSSS